MISLAWEPIPLKNGDILLNNIYGKHVRMKQPNPLVIEILQLCNGNNTLQQIKDALWSKGFTVDLSIVEKVIASLSKEKIIVENERYHLPDWIDDEEYERYYTLISWFDRFQLDTPSIELFRKIKRTRIGIVGMGGVGTLLSMMLAATGVGYLRIIDQDIVESSNLVRQIFYNESDLGSPKVSVMKKRIKDFNSRVFVETHNQYIDSKEDAKQLLKELDFVFLTADAPRFILNRWVNEACIELKTPYVYSFAGMVAPIYIPGESACFSCLETHMRKRMGSVHDEIVEGLQKLRTRKYPSMATGITIVSDLHFKDAMGYLTSTYEPHTKNKLIKIVGSQLIEEDVERDRSCVVCGEVYND